MYSSVERKITYVNLCIRAYAGFTSLGRTTRFSNCCDVLCSVVFYRVTAVYTAPWSHGTSSAPLRVEVVSSLSRQHIVLPSRRFREDGGVLEVNGEETARGHTLGAPAVAKYRSILTVTLCIPCGARGTYILKKTLQFSFWTSCVTLAHSVFAGFSWTQHH